MNTSNSLHWAHSRQSVALIAAALAMSLILGTGFLLIQYFRPPVGSLDHPAQPLTDTQAMAQVMRPAREITTTAQLQAATGGYLLMSCTDLHHPPYQGAVFMNFQLPSAGKNDMLLYFRKIADALVANGWTEGLPPNQHLLGHTLTKHGVTAIFYPNPDRASFGIMQLYGECRDMTDHANDTSAWTDITGQLR
jgi:hypothetical protein